MTTTDFGPLEPLLSDPSIMEIMVNGYDQIFVERRGKLEQIDQVFDSEDHLMQIINDSILEPAGRQVNESQPIADIRFIDGSRCHIVIPPIARRGASIVIRRLPPTLLTVEDLLRFGSFTPPMVQFLRAAVEARLNIVMSGGTGSGKTTVLNILGNMIPPEERVITIENDAELRLTLPHLVVLETRPANLEGRGEITARQLVTSALKMRPERIIMAEARGGEMVEMLQALNTGHDGSMLSLHANSPLDALTRLEVMVTMGMPQIPLLSIRQQLASGLHLILQQDRMSDGIRRLTRISEVTGLEGGMLTVQDIFEFEQTGYENGKIVGIFRPTGIIPQVWQRMQGNGVTLGESVFEA